MELAVFCPKSHGQPRVDDSRVLSGIIFVNRNGQRWRAMGIFIRMMDGLSTGTENLRQSCMDMDAAYLKAHRAALSLRLKKGAGRLIARMDVHSTLL